MLVRWNIKPHPQQRDSWVRGRNNMNEGFNPVHGWKHELIQTETTAVIDCGKYIPNPGFVTGNKPKYETAIRWLENCGISLRHKLSPTDWSSNDSSISLIGSIRNIWRGEYNK